MEPVKKTACILCSINCGIEVELDGRRLARIHGDREHPGSRGYTCEKALRLDYYQNGRHRLTSPLRRRPDGSFEEISWADAIREISARFAAVRDTHGGETIFYYGGGGQGNHLGGAYGRATRAALGSIYASNALAQEKTGEFWVDGQLFGRPRCHTCADLEHAEVAVIIGKNPWHSHGFQRARVVLRDIARDPRRTLIVIDPRRTETAELADIHLQLRPGTDAFCLSALLAVMEEEDLLNHAFLRERASGLEALLPALRAVPIAHHCAAAGLAEEQVRQAARRIATASSVSTVEDLGIQQTLHSTLNSYLEKLLYLLTGNFARPGAMNLHSHFASLGGGGGGGSPRTSPVGGHRVITGLTPANVIPDEILSDHPRRFRAMLVESANPAHSLADSPRMREALRALELLVVIDVAHTETAQLAHYVLPAASQFEKWEATFFNLEFPNNHAQLRAPLLDPLPGTLPEAEIHRRLVRALGALDGEEEALATLRAAAAESRARYAMTFLTLTTQRPRLAALAPVVLYETLGPTLPPGAADTAVLWGLCHTCAMSQPDSLRRAGLQGEGLELGEAFFTALLQQRSGVIFTVDDYAETWRRVATPDHRVRLAIPELLAELSALRPAPPRPDFPLVLSAGERRSSTANTIFRDPAWRKRDAEGALRIHPDDAQRLGIREGAQVRVTTRRGSVVTVAALTDTLLPGHITLPNGQGISEGPGAPPNELTASEDRDWLAGTPWHKHVPARVEALPQAETLARDVTVPANPTRGNRSPPKRRVGVASWRRSAVLALVG